MQSQKILYPKKISEFEVHSDLFHKLKEELSPLGFEIRGEVPLLTLERFGRARRQVSRFDIVIFRGKNPLLVIEVKKRSSRGWQKQKRKYSQYGTRVTLCCGPNQINNTIKFCKRFCK